jgi:hypothetical protein
MIFSFVSGDNSMKLFITGRSVFTPTNIFQWWVISLDKYVQKKDHKGSLKRILFTGTLQPGPYTSTWDSGYGKILSNSTQRSCQYMSNKGTLPGNPGVSSHLFP